jgi:hypothetical protein
VIWTVGFPLAVAVVGVVVLWFSPLLGAIILVGAVMALGWLSFPAAVERVAGWLSGAPVRRRR